ncbi:hypothetical protein POG22_09165 [Geitlerinema sp. CS-897]|nr:hypothetical protein [Geitlerinema sp. CS-897]
MIHREQLRLHWDAFDVRPTTDPDVKHRSKFNFCEFLRSAVVGDIAGEHLRHRTVKVASVAGL